MALSSKEDRWNLLLKRWQECELTISAFCRQQRVPLHQFYYWREKLSHSSDASPSQQLVPVLCSALEPDGPTLCLRLPNGASLEGLSVDQLRLLLPEVAAL